MRHMRSYNLLALGVIILAGFARPWEMVEPAAADPQNMSPADLIAGFRGVATASISDAVDAVTGRRGFMSRDMRPIIDKKIVGQAVTALVKPGIIMPTDRSAISHSIDAIEEANPGDIFVTHIEDGLDIAGIGGLMATTCMARGLGGAIIDAAARDIQEMADMGFQVYCRGITPATSLGRYVSVAKNVPIPCAGTTVHPGDYIIGDRDGVVVVPETHAGEVLRLAREFEEKEKKMVPLIQQYKSLKQALAAYGRI